MNEADLLSSLGLAKMSTTGVAVVVALIILSIWSFSLSAERLITFRRARRQSLEYARLLARKPETEREDWLRDAVEAAGRFPHSHLARVVAAGLITWQQKHARGGLPADAIIEASARAVDRTSMVMLSSLRRGVGTLATIATISPFVGLFGTVWGIYHALTAIGISGQASIDKVAGPVGEALIMTAIGLAVAIPAVLAYNWLARRNKAVMDEVREFADELNAVIVGSAGKAA